MKILQKIGIVWAVLLFTSAPAYAQFTILPAADPKVDCKEMLTKFEIDGKPPTEADVANNIADKVTSDYKDAPEIGLCSNPDNANEGICKEFADKNKQASDQALKNKDNKAKSTENLLGCAIKEGQISLQMIPYFIQYIANFALSLVGLLCVLFIVIGGYYYIYGGLADSKEKGKKTITNALLGVVVASLAWVIVNIVMNLVTT